VLGIERTRRRQILALALPIIGGMVSQNVLNLVDTLMVGQLGKEALAAVGFGGFATFMATAFLTGMGAGVQAMVARRKGEGHGGEAVPLNGGLILVAIIAVPLSAALIALAPAIFELLSTDPAVVETGTPYFQARLVATIAVGANFAFRGYWNGVNLSGLYLRTLLVMHACNVALNFLLIFGYLGFPALGATGAGIGTAISTFIGTAYYFALGRRHAASAGFLAAMPSRNTLRTILRVSVPSGVQTFLFAAGLTALFAIIDRVGTAEAAAANVLMNISLVAFLPGLGLGLASASLVGQALGRRDFDDATRWGWEVVRIGVVMMAAIGLPMAIAPELLLSPFFAGETEPLALAVGPLRLVGLTIGIEALTMVLLNSIVGAGATTLALIIAVAMQWGLFLPLAYLVGPVLGGGLMTIWIVNVGYRALMGLILVAVWKSRRWAKVRV
jgi:putative MATE family efflux protein